MKDTLPLSACFVAAILAVIWVIRFSPNDHCAERHCPSWPIELKVSPEHTPGLDSLNAGLDSLDAVIERVKKAKLSEIKALNSLKRSVDTLALETRRAAAIKTNRYR